MPVMRTFKQPSVNYFREDQKTVTFKGNQFLKISVNSESQKTEHMLDQISSGPSRPQPEISSVIQDQDQEPEIKSKLSILRSGIIIDSSLKNKINSFLRDESLYSDIFVELDSGKKEVKRKGEVYKIKRDLLVVHQEGQEHRQRLGEHAVQQHLGAGRPRRP